MVCVLFDWPDPVGPGLAVSFSPAAGETTGQTGSDRVWPFKRTQPLCIRRLMYSITSSVMHYAVHLDPGAKAKAVKIEPKNIRAEANRISVEPKLQNV